MDIVVVSGKSGCLVVLKTWCKEVFKEVTLNLAW